MPSCSTLALVEGLFTSKGDSDPHCPFSRNTLTHGSSENKFHFSHWVTKCLQSHLSMIQLDDNASNIVPTLDIIHTNLELHHRCPNLSLKFYRSVNTEYDEYIIVLNSALRMTHALRCALGNNKTAVIPVGSRPFVEVHYRVFCAHHSIPCITSHISVAQNLSWFDQVQADLMFGLSMMASPFVKDMKKKALKDSKFAQPDHIQVNGYPEQYLAPADARKLVGTTIKVSSELFPNWKVDPHMCNTFVVRHNAGKHSFELMFPDEYAPSEVELFRQQGRRIRGGQPNIKIYSGIKEATLLKFMNPAEALTLEKCYKAERRRARSTSSDNAPRKSAKQELSGSSGTVGQTWPQFPPGRQISVLFSTRWVEGVIAESDGSVITVVYDDGEERAHNAAELTAYKLLAEPTGAPTGALMCVQCRTWHHQIDGPKDKICCSKCKVPALVSCPQRGGRLHARQQAAVGHAVALAGSAEPVALVAASGSSDGSQVAGEAGEDSDFDVFEASDDDDLSGGECCYMAA